MCEVEYNPTAIRSLGGKACALAEELRTIRRKWMRVTDKPVSAFGLEEIESAFQSCERTWADELEVYTQVLERLCGKLDIAAGNYRATDHANEHAVKQI